jgi:RNA polymerase sigma factor (sigma-70 family)
MRNGRFQTPLGIPGSGQHYAEQHERPAHEALNLDLNRLFRAARPRLIRLARAHGVSHDTADDAVQETLLVAWRRLDYLHSPEHFDAWLNGICHHVSQHFIRRDRITARRLVTFSQAQGDHGDDRDADREDDPLPDISDHEDGDLGTELHREDLEILVDRALGYISESSRTLVELCYLAELPQREAADRLGLTLGALELRLHRTRRELRHILKSTLRNEAQSLGLFLDEDVSGGWRESREWCNFCGRHRLRGEFEGLPGGRVNFRLRCPECSPRFGGDIYSTGGAIPLGGTHSFRPALKRLIAFLKHHYAQDYSRALQIGWHPCPSCHNPVPMRMMAAGHDLGAFPEQWCLVFACPMCGRIVSPAAFATCWAHPRVTPVALQFIEAHPRWIIEPDVLTTYAGQPAIRFRLSDVAGAAQLTILSDVQTLQVRALSQV